MTKTQRTDIGCIRDGKCLEDTPRDGLTNCAGHEHREAG